MIGAGRHTKAKRQVPGRVSLRLRICLSLSKLINPLGFEPRRAPSFYLLVKTAGRVSFLSIFFFPSLSFTPGVNSSAPSPPPVISQCVYLRSPSTNSSSVQLTRANSFEVLPGNGLPGPPSRCLAQLKVQGKWSSLPGDGQAPAGPAETLPHRQNQQAGQARLMPLPCPVLLWRKRRPPRGPERRTCTGSWSWRGSPGRTGTRVPRAALSCQLRALLHLRPCYRPGMGGSHPGSAAISRSPESLSTGTCLVMKTSHVCYHGSHTFPHRGPGPGGRTNVFLWVKFLQGHGKIF